MRAFKRTKRELLAPLEHGERFGQSSREKCAKIMENASLKKKHAYMSVATVTWIMTIEWDHQGRNTQDQQLSSSYSI